MQTVFTEVFPSVGEIDRREVFRYAGCSCPNTAEEKLLDDCINECSDIFVYKIAYSLLPVNINGNKVSFPFGSVQSDNFAKYITGYDGAVMFAATVGFAADRLIKKYSVISPSKALIISALGSERVEALCDRFCERLKERYNCAKSRFSAGYGDFDISGQEAIINYLNAGRLLGITLSQSRLMSPEKSVTAFVGINDFQKT